MLKHFRILYKDRAGLFAKGRIIQGCYYLFVFSSGRRFRFKSYNNMMVFLQTEFKTELIYEESEI